MIPTDKNTFKEYCLRKLGSPVIRVNVAEEQVDDRIDEALFKYYERHYHAVEEVYIVYELCENDLALGYIVLPPDIVAVTDTFKLSYTGSMFNIEFQYMQSELYSFSSIYRFGDLTYYYMMQSQFSLINRFFAPDKQFQFNPNTNKFIVLGGLKNSARFGRHIAIKAYKKILGEEDATFESVGREIVANIWKDKWLQDYATALIKFQWAQNLSKYKSIQLIGGVEMSGAEMKAEAKEEIEMLLKQVDNDYQFPVPFIMG